MDTKLEFTDTLYKKIRRDIGNTAPMNILYCFSKPSTGDALCTLSTALLHDNSQGEVTALNILTTQQASKIENIEHYRQNIFGEITKRCEEAKIRYRSFVEISDNFVHTIFAKSNAYSCSLILLGMGQTVFSDAVWSKITENIPSSSIVETENKSERYNPENTESLSRGVSSLIQRNPKATGIFLIRDFNTIQHVFVLILDKDDIYTFIYLLGLFDNKNLTFTIWDAIGIFEHDTELNKIRKKMQRKYRENLTFLNNDKKIDIDFIHSIDLTITGVNGWQKLINSAIPWKNNLPSTLILKHEKNEIK